MGAPTSAILGEAYTQYTEHKNLHPMLKKHQIIGYFRYIDDILIIYNQNKTSTEETEFNKQTTSIKFTTKKNSTTPLISWI
jgi:hypothetical protein